MFDLFDRIRVWYESIVFSVRLRYLMWKDKCKCCKKDK